METFHGQYGNENRSYQKPFMRSPNVSNIMKVSVPIGNLPASIDLRNTAKVPIYDQGATGSCSANAICASYSLLNMLNQKPPISLSRLFVYYNSRVMDNTQNIDAGAHLYLAFNTMQTNGCCLETMWPFYANLITVQPPSLCYQEALTHCTTQQDTQLDPNNLLLAIKQCLVNNLPPVIGILVYSSFESAAAAQTGMIPMPNIQTEQLLGGHALMVVGYDDVRGVVIFQNSWSANWADGGYGYLPYAFISNPYLTSDCHAFTQVEIDRSLVPRCNLCGK